MTSLHERFVSVPGSCPPGFGDGKAAATMPALHPKRAEKVDFVTYKAPPSEFVEDKAISEEWITRTTFIEDDLRWLLKLPHDRFWCQVVFNSSLRQCVGSFLHHAPRPFDLEVKLSSELRQKNDTLCRLFFLVCLRMSTHKESKENHISPEVFGEILYENFIFDIPKIMDICVLYGKGNESIVAKMVSNIFTQQKKYHDDLKAVVPTIIQVFDAVCSNCGFQGESLSPPKRIMNKANQLESPLITMPTEKFQDVISYLSDIAHTLRSFLEIFPQGASAFIQGNFPQRLAALYEAISSGFGAAFKERRKQHTDDSLLKSLKWIIRHVKLCLLHVFHSIVYELFLQPLLESTSEESASEYAEEYVNVLTSILSEKRFLADLQMLFPFELDKDILKQSVYKIDHTRFQYIEDAISEAVMAYGLKPKNQTAAQVLKPDPMLESACANDLHQDEDNESDRYEELGACAPRKTGIELESLVYTVKDLLPDLGTGFIKLCLEEYNYDSERVISSILDNSLPPSLQNVDRMLQSSAVTAEVGSKKDKAVLNGSSSEVEQKSLLGDRLNIYDGDEFDVFQNNVDVSRVHIGKKNKTAAAVGDKSEVSSMKSFYKKYEDIVDIVEGGDGDDYDDEYDDTYDSNIVGMIDDDSPDELVARRPFVTPRILEKVEPRKRVEYSEEEDSEEERKRRDHFIEDPAKLRQMREERFAAQHANQRRGRGNHVPAGPDNGQEVPRDLKGGPKGQGQNADVLRNRAYKERHKDSRVHHNRRDLADRKRKV